MKGELDKSKKTLTIKLDNQELQFALKGDDLAGVIWDISMWLREELKYRNAGPEIERCQKRLYELLTEATIPDDWYV